MSGAMDIWSGDNADRSFSPTTVFPPIPAWATKREPYCDGIHYERSPTAELFCHNIDFEETVIPGEMVMSANHHVDGSTGLVPRYAATATNRSNSILTKPYACAMRWTR